VEQQPDDKGGDLWERRYVMLGMEEYYEWVNHDPKVLQSLVRQADCLLSQIGDPPKISILDLGWSADNIGYEKCHIESSCLLEPFTRLYNITGEQRFLDFATYIVKSGGTKHYNVFEQAYNNVKPYQMAGHYPKCYEMIALFEGLVDYYRITGEDYWRQSAMNLYNNIRDNEITLIGTGGADYPYHPQVVAEAWDNTAFEQTNPDIRIMNETCTGISWLKYCSVILRLTGDSRVADEIEKYVFNNLHSILKPSGDGCCVYSYLNGLKISSDGGWGWDFEDGLRVTCCNLNVPAGLAYLPYIAVTGDKAGIVLNMFLPAKVTTETPSKKPLQILVETDFPLSSKIAVSVDPDTPETFSLKLRIPAWSVNNTLKVNGKKLKADIIPGTYAEINREWKQGDRVELDLDMKCRIIDAPRGSNRAGDNFQAVLYGPIVLTRNAETDTDYNKPVTVKADKNGIIKTRPTVKDGCLEFVIPTVSGSAIRMVDYASVNGWKGSKICTWMPKVIR
jgi:DUF1680 family protein